MFWRMNTTAKCITSHFISFSFKIERIQAENMPSVLFKIIDLRHKTMSFMNNFYQKQESKNAFFTNENRYKFLWMK